ncbi:hypothetical protein O3M35_009066 [Rhynocoris fuscipes]|uniref:Odorant receptor n=1 Tax=Rhynocoris fuscipes TaxID=488301 RepID=A0AAW1D559_9HEMI
MQKFLDNLCSEDGEIVDKVMYDEYKYLLRVSCIYPKLNTSKWRKLSIIQFILYLSCLLYHLIIFIITATKLKHDKTEMFQSLHYLALAFMMTYIIIICNKNRKKNAQIHRGIATGLSGNQNYDEEIKILKKPLVYKLRKKKKMFIQLLLTYFLTLPLIMLLLEKYLNAYSDDYKEVLLSPNLPLTLWVPYDTNNLIGCSTAIFLMASFCALVAVIACTFDGTIFVICEYLAMEVKLLILSLNRLPERTLNLYRLRHGDNINVSIETIKENTNLSNCYRDCLKQNIIHHQNIIKKFYLCRKQIGLVLCLTLAMCAVIIAMSGVSLIRGEGKIGTRLVSALFCFVEILVCFFLVNCCSQITNASEDLIHTLYSTKWMSLNINEVQMIRIMMLRSQIPLLMSYRNITNFDYVTFTSIMNTAYSYFNLLLAFS